MSLLPKDERPKLKASRFNKFRSSSISEKEEDDTSATITKRGYKRGNSDNDNFSLKSKRVCTSNTLFTYPPSPVKNLANNRLKKLKEQIQAERIADTNKSSVSSKSRFQRSDNEYTDNTKSIKINPDIKSPTHMRKNSAQERLTPDKSSVSSKFHHNNAYRDVYTKSIKINSSPTNSRKNLADERLKDIKRNLKNSDNSRISKAQSDPVLQTLSNAETKGSLAHQPAIEIMASKEEYTSNLILGSGSRSKFDNEMEVTASPLKDRPHQSNLNGITVNCIQEITRDSQGAADDEMEWTSAEPNKNFIDASTNVNEVSKEDQKIEEVIKDPEKIKDICIVVDTNVFIGGLSKIQDVLNLKVSGPFKPIVFVPWMVITELDYMKDSCSDTKLSRNILNAIKFINGALKEKNPQVIGQTVFEVEKQKHVGTSPDDKIIACCLQVVEKYETVILLSNDTNLKNKAMINDITACSSNEIMMKLMFKLGRNTKYKKITSRMGIMCSTIICDCMKVTYGDVWLKMNMMSCPPWSLMECLKRFKKYWSSVFREKLMKQFTKTLQDLQNVIETNNCMSDDSEDFVKFMKLCISLCIFLKDIEESRGFVENTLTEITRVA